MDTNNNSNSYFRALFNNVPSLLSRFLETELSYGYWMLNFFIGLFGQRSSSLSIAERICAACIPLIAIIEAAVFSIAGCCEKRQLPRKCRLAARDLSRVANESRCNFLLFLCFCFSRLSFNMFVPWEITKFRQVEETNMLEGFFKIIICEWFFSLVCNWNLNAGVIACAVTVNEIEALHELYDSLSCSIIKDGLIHKVIELLSFLPSILQLRSLM